ncbi:hypothetical protein B0H63DRAFT_487976 [Podospora didyma]|uniref:Uncharacterized protein n=1 Tax=Podospora didyma TaxID=330526 RepID=A0AAE0K268_9PEZI|nr:hypothetical protein B0H63DRAFT_487976 [Podospora didyma]
MPRPRPKRSRVATTVTKPNAPPSVPSSDIYDISDREKERIRKKRASEGAPAVPGQEGRASSSLRLNPEQAKALEDSRNKRDQALDRLANISSTNKASDSSDVEYSRREESAIAPKPRLTDVSGLDLDDSMFGNLEDSLEDSHNAIDETTQNGYRSTDTSSFNVNLFKRRPRQSSIVGKDDAPIRPSSRGPNTPSISSTFNLGKFRRRAREPSILGTAQKDRTQRSASQVSQARSIAGDDSGPDDESTPLDLAKRRSGRLSRSAVDNSSREESPIVPSRKRKSLEDQVGREKRLAVEDEIHQSIEVQSGSSSPVPSLSSSLRGPRGLPQDRLSTPGPHPIDENDPDMAPPLSSGSSNGGSPVLWPSLESLAHRTYYRERKPAAAARAAKTPEPDADDDALASDISSPPSLTHSPNYAAPVAKPNAVKKKPAAAPKPALTADLTSLLPRRRHTQKSTRRNKDPFDLGSSDEGSENEDKEDDELSYMVDARAAARRKKKKAAAATLPLSRSSNRKGKETAQVSSTKTQKKPGIRTYGSRSSDKENNDDSIEVEGEEEDGDGGEAEEDEMDPETSQMIQERIGEELNKARKKFKEVDMWELSFEEVTGSSSPPPPDTIEDAAEEEEVVG